MPPKEAEINGRKVVITPVPAWADYRCEDCGKNALVMVQEKNKVYNPLTKRTYQHWFWCGKCNIG